ncbi:hypothetical protein B1748_25860 [Paenibacillus sp. MY03]|uniref:hypothetical protein n=1 Tax=Paenibacillus sp. MY03 TaxID=302980 RepID=UPI000B3D2AD8|nr:hypothetical protein [Paenibacillus sp. MY03]OUS71935.1 hypothetical protein B1748_25860 [Paenibacillus sp. MY03]
MESAMVFPMLFILIFLFLFMSMFVYQNVIVSYTAAVTSERAAFAWDNSHRDPRSGILTEAAYDGLYTELGSDGVTGSLFGLIGHSETASVSLPSGRTEGAGSSLAVTKLDLASDWIAAAGLSYSGEVTRADDGLFRLVRTKLEKPIGSDVFRSWGKGEFVDPTGQSKALITAPVDFVRHVDLARYYAKKFSGSSAGKATSKKQAGKVLSSYGGGSQP